MEAGILAPESAPAVLARLLPYASEAEAVGPAQFVAEAADRGPILRVAVLFRTGQLHHWFVRLG